MTTEIKPGHIILIEEAINEGLGLDSFDSVGILTRGLSDSTLYRVDADDKSYVIRIADPRDKRFIENEYVNMRQAAEAGFAPHLYYLNEKNGIALMAHIDAKSYRIREEKIPLFADFIRRLHAIKTFSDKDNCYHHIERMYKAVHKIVQHPALEEAFHLYQSVRPILAELGAKTNTHGDLNPNNVIFDGERFWLVDWATASVQSKYVDLACIMNFYFPQNLDLQRTFLDHYYQGKRTAVDMTNIKLMQPISIIYYGLGFIYLNLIHSKHYKMLEPMYTLPHYRQFNEIIKMGQQDNITPAEEIEFALLYIKEALNFNNMQQ